MANPTLEPKPAELAKTRWFRTAARRLALLAVRAISSAGASAVLAAGSLWAYSQLVYSTTRNEEMNKKAMYNKGQAFLRMATATVSAAGKSPQSPLDFLHIVSRAVRQSPTSPALVVPTSPTPEALQRASLDTVALWVALVVHLVLGVAWLGKALVSTWFPAGKDSETTARLVSHARELMRTLEENAARGAFASNARAPGIIAQAVDDLEEAIESRDPAALKAAIRGGQGAILDTTHLHVFPSSRAQKRT